MKDNFPITWMCQKLDIPRSSFYAWRSQVNTVTNSVVRRNELKDRVRQVFTDRRKVYGCRRITAELNAAGITCSVGLVASDAGNGLSGYPASGIEPYRHPRKL